MADTLAQLEADYCPPLDSALFAAIVSDYDLADENDLQAARATLDSLGASAVLEESTLVDPSGSGRQNVSRSDKTPGPASSCPDTNGSLETDLTSLSNGLSSLELDLDVLGDAPEFAPFGDGEELEKLDHDTKLALLKSLFGRKLSDHALAYTLKKSNGNWHAAMEASLNHVYFDEAELSDGASKIPSRGVDAFSEDHILRGGRKGKRKQKRFQALDDYRSPIDPPTPTSNKWQTAVDDIDFIASRVGMSHMTVSSIYYGNGASLTGAIVAVLKSSIVENKHIVSDDTVAQTHAAELGYDFPHIPPDYLATLIRLTHPSTANAHELAKALATRTSSATSGGLQVIPKYAPVKLVEEDIADVVTLPHSQTGSQSPSADLGLISARATAYSAARETALAQARAAYRKSKSDRLMGGAAGYYSQVGREYGAVSNSAAASVADRIAASQSTASQLDLHGIDVQNGVRVAQQKVQQWWDGLGESRVNGRIGAGERHVGYTIIVGLGRHSEGGKGKLGPAVNKALTAQGWRVESGSGLLHVRGKIKR